LIEAARPGSVRSHKQARERLLLAFLPDRKFGCSLTKRKK
jgi:hypothetical protein